MTQDLGATTYSFDTHTPDYVVRNEQGRYLSTPGYDGWGAPTQEMASSDNGKFVAIAWSNGGFSLVDVTADCGQPLLGDLGIQEGMTGCATSDVGIGRIFANFRGAHRPHFRGNGEQLDLFVTSWVGSDRAVSFTAPGVETPHKLELLALGDFVQQGTHGVDWRSLMPVAIGVLLVAAAISITILFRRRWAKAGG